MARLVAQQIGAEGGPTIVVESHPGAATEIGTELVAHAAPALSLFIYLLGKAPNLPLILPGDFLPVGSLADEPLLICASARSGIKTLPELIARANSPRATHSLQRE